MFLFTPWGRFRAFRDRARTTQFLAEVAEEGADRLKEEIKSPPKTGRMYRRRGRMHQASAPGEFPANDTGRLAASVEHESDARRAVFGTTIYYGKFLREGTRKMARRRMSDDVLKLVVPRAMAKLRGWIVWKRG